MTLTMGPAPFGPKSKVQVNFEREGPAHALLFEAHPRRIRAELGGETVIDSREGSLLHETALLPVWYGPRDALNEALLEPSDHTTHCPFKGDASYYHLRVGDRLVENAVWYYPDPNPESAWLKDHVALYWGRMDAWYEEDERVEGHLRDPYHRVDVRHGSRHVKVSKDDRVLAESDRPALLFETSLPTRYYLPPQDVNGELLQSSDTRTHCPYKGDAAYKALDGEDVAWFYDEPLEEAASAKGYYCFDPSKVTLEVDGVALTG